MLSNIPETFYPYKGLCKYISHQFHKEIGKPKVAHRISSDVQWARSNKCVADYCMKFSNGKDQKYLLPRLEIN